MIELKTPKEIEEMKPAGRFVGGILRDSRNLPSWYQICWKSMNSCTSASSIARVPNPGYVDYAPDFGTARSRTIFAFP